MAPFRIRSEIVCERMTGVEPAPFCLASRCPASGPHPRARRSSALRAQPQAHEGLEKKSAPAQDHGDRPLGEESNLADESGQGAGDGSDQLSRPTESNRCPQCLVPTPRLELGRPFGHWFLRPARLPITPDGPMCVRDSRQTVRVTRILSRGPDSGNRTRLSALPKTTVSHTRHKQRSRSRLHYSCKSP